MGERKVINKYYPPDFDPALMPRGKKPKNGQYTVRMMMPMSVRCLTCGDYIYKGKKFNSKKETVEGEDYLGIKIFRFYMRCANCSSEFTIKTDPKNSDYVAELGVSRNFEPWRAEEKEIEAAKRERELEEKGDAMKALENRTLDSKLEMDIIEALDEIRSLNARNSKLNPDSLLEYHSQLREHDRQTLGAEEQQEMQAFHAESAASSEYVRRLQPIDDDDEATTMPVPKRAKQETPIGSAAAATASSAAAHSKQPVSFLPITKRKEPEKKPAVPVKLMPKVAVVKKVAASSAASGTMAASTPATNSKPAVVSASPSEPPALGLTSDYGSDSDNGEGAASLVDY